MSWTPVNLYDAAIRQRLLAEIVESDADILLLVENTEETVWYAACRVGTDIRGVVIYLELADADEDSCLVKIVEEEEGPIALGAPHDILDQLSPTTNPTATQWREACRKANLGARIIQPYSR